VRICDGKKENDAALIAAERRVKECLAKADTQSGVSKESIFDEIGAQAHLIFNTPPDTLIGAAVKLQMLVHPELGVEDDRDSEVMIALRQVLDCIERSIDDAPQRSRQVSIGESAAQLRP